MPTTAGPIEAVIFDWGGTLTPWHDIDFGDEARALARAARRPTPVAGVAGGEGDGDGDGDDEFDRIAAALALAGDVVWGRARDDQLSGTIAAVFAEAGWDYDPGALSDYQQFWEPHTVTDPVVGTMFGELHAAGLRIGVLSNTIWPREWHQRFFDRDGVGHLIDGAVYTSEIAWTKPSPHAFTAAMHAVGVSDPARCVFVGDRLFDDIWGAGQIGMRTIHIPHSTIPHRQVGHSLGVPDAVAQSLVEIPALVRNLTGRRVPSGDRPATAPV